MTLAPDCLKFLRILSMGGDAPAADIAAQREKFRKLLSVAAGPTPQNIGTEDRTIEANGAGLKLRLYRRADLGDRSLPTCVFFHGGGFIAGSIETHDGICRTLADASGWQIVAVDYRLAPQHRYPAPVDDGLAVLDAIDKSPGDYRALAGRMAVAGDSVGAGLAGYLAQQWHARSRSPLALQVLLCPALDPRPRFASRKTLARGYYIEDHMIEADFAAYRGALDTVPTVFEAGDLSGLPPAIIHVAEYDPFCDEGVAYADALEAAGVAVKLVRHAGMLHLFHAFSRFIPAGADALRQIGEEMKAFR